MDHLTDKQLLELLGQFSDQSDRLGKHLDQCDSCFQRWQVLQESWNALGAWTVDMPRSDLTDRILRQIVSAATAHLR